MTIGVRVGRVCRVAAFFAAVLAVCGGIASVDAEATAHSRVRHVVVVGGLGDLVCCALCPENQLICLLYMSFVCVLWEFRLCGCMVCVSGGLACSDVVASCELPLVSGEEVSLAGVVGGVCAGGCERRH